jgi:hypothetical protein
MPSITTTAKHAAAKRVFALRSTAPAGGKHAARTTRRARRRALASARLAR